MADNVTANGVTIATNDVSGVHYQKWKIVDGTAAGTAGAPVTAASGLYVDDRSAVSSVTTTSVDTSGAAVVTIAASNSSRRKLTVANTSATQFLYLRCASGATLTNWGVPIPPLSYWEMPFNYTGVVTGILASADAGATAKVQEF